MEERGEIRRITRRKAPVQRYKFVPAVQPSESHISAASVTQADVRVLVGLQKASETHIERLIGFGLLPADATPQSHSRALRRRSDAMRDVPGM